MPIHTPHWRSLEFAHLSLQSLAYMCDESDMFQAEFVPSLVRLRSARVSSRTGHPSLVSLRLVLKRGGGRVTLNNRTLLSNSVQLFN
jgi:hypothetical protein